MAKEFGLFISISIVAADQAEAEAFSDKVRAWLGQQRTDLVVDDIEIEEGE